ncbi:Gamma-tubulin complex component protein [Phytophthora cactorum]|nr:Gamma-tubulin complex component protein [Phytophthora cactorum]
MNPERQAARLKRRAERLAPPSRAHSSSVGTRHSYTVSSDASSSRTRGSSVPIDSNDSLRRPPVASASSATVVAMSTRRSSNARSPRDINVLVDKLLAKVHGAPSAITTRRTVVRLHDAVSTVQQTDAFSVLEKIKRKIATDAPQFYADSQDTVTRLNEVYSRFVKFKNLDKKTEALLLLYGLMDTAPPPLHSEEVHRHPDFAAKNMDSYPAESTPGSLDSSVSEKKGYHHRSQSMPLSLEAQNAAPMEQSKTDLDSLEDSFKFAVGIGPAHKPSRGRGTSPRTHSGAPSTAAGRSSFDVPEEVLLRDVLYALQAIESRYLYFDDAADRFQITRSVGVPTPMRELIHMLCDLGWIFRKISEYIKQHREELAFGLIDEDAETRQPHERGFSSLTLRTLIVWLQDPLDRMRLMARLIDSVEGLRGVRSKSAKQIAAPIVRMIKRWVFEGELEDVHGEFFVVADSTVSDDQFWAKKYTLNLKMLPTFISVELAKKILVIGKSINFIRQCCGNADWVMDAAQETAVIGMETGHEGAYFAELKRLETVIENVSNSTNEYLIRTLMEKYRLLDHCQALKRYLLLGQVKSGPELSKRGTQVYRHTLTNVLETALNASNAKFESADILGRLDVELLQGSSVNSVIPASSMLQYQQIFDFLWRMKRVEHSLSASWTKDMNLGHEVQVLETAWHKLGFMMKESRELLKQLKLIFATVIRFCKAQENLYTTAMHEKHVEERHQQLIQHQELGSSWGIPEEDEYTMRAERDAFGANSKILRQIEEISEDFSNQFLELLEIVKQNSIRYGTNCFVIEFSCSHFDAV